MAQNERTSLDEGILASMGEKFEKAHLKDAAAFEARMRKDPTDIKALIGLADTNILLYVFGYRFREETIPRARAALKRAAGMSSADGDVDRLSGILTFLDWNWGDAEEALQEAIKREPQNLNARHWYSLYLVAMGRFDEAMAQSDRMMELDPDENYLVGRGSLLYFQHRFEELKELMQRTIEKDPTVPWGYDWLGMAYNGLEEHDDAIQTYARAFELSDGTAEVGAGYAHALGLAGEIDQARQIANYYASVSEQRYVPPVQRAYIHIGLGEYDEAIRLLEQAYSENSWFLCFAKVEPWLDPLRPDSRFADLIQRMEFP
jgi:tetratricopeptide (TPR) repeat protein